MENKAFKKILNLYTSLLELHEENQFKIRNLSSKIFNLDRLGLKLSEAAEEEMENHPGIGKKISEAIGSIRKNGSFPDLDEYLSKTPKGVVEMLGIKGIGAKKVGVIWKELGVETIEDLYKAADDGFLAKLPGFGEKTQKIILDGLDYKKEQEGKGLYADWESIATEIENKLSPAIGDVSISRIGGLAQADDILESLDWLIEKGALISLKGVLEEIPNVEIKDELSGPKIIRGFIADTIPFSFKAEPRASFGNAEIYFSSPQAFLHKGIKENGSLQDLLKGKEFSDSNSAFKEFGVDYVSPELRNIQEILGNSDLLEKLINDHDITGVLHTHSTYSDGNNSIEEMAIASKEKGYQYLGMSDHSRSAFYANGLDEDRINDQHEEIDDLNKKLAPFKIFKGIESDILNDGSLDYHDDVLGSFDFIVASIHSNLRMDERKATSRLLNAIENPFTTILGHPTGRLLLQREAYPIDHKMVIEACAASNVIIEINASPWRLDLDWRWVGYAQEKGVMISINPDAHSIKGIDDIRYGVICGRKGGLTKSNTLNAKSINEVESIFETKNPSK